MKSHAVPKVKAAYGDFGSSHMFEAQATLVKWQGQCSFLVTKGSCSEELLCTTCTFR